MCKENHREAKTPAVYNNRNGGSRNLRQNAGRGHPNRHPDVHRVKDLTSSVRSIFTRININRQIIGEWEIRCHFNLQKKNYNAQRSFPIYFYRISWTMLAPAHGISCSRSSIRTRRKVASHADLIAYRSDARSNTVRASVNQISWEEDFQISDFKWSRKTVEETYKVTICRIEFAFLILQFISRGKFF